MNKEINATENSDNEEEKFAESAQTKVLGHDIMMWAFTNSRCQHCDQIHPITFAASIDGDNYNNWADRHYRLAPPLLAVIDKQFNKWAKKYGVK